MDRATFTLLLDLCPRPERVRDNEIFIEFAEFAEEARGIADDAETSREDRLAELAELQPAALPEEAVVHARAVLEAAEKDVRTPAFRSWSELLAYARYASAPWGRLMLSLYGEPRESWPAADPVFCALSVLERLNVCGADWRGFGRLYLPGDWMRRAGAATEALGEPRSGPELGAVYGQLLARADELSRRGGAEAGRVRDADARVALRVFAAGAGRMAARLARHDPLIGPAALSRLDLLRIRLAGRWAERRAA